MLDPMRAPVSVQEHAGGGRYVGPIPSWLGRYEGHRLPLVALLCAAGAFGLWSLLRTPAPFVDEAWYASRAWALIHTGRAFGALDAGVFEGFDGHWTYFPWLGTWFQTLPMRVLGLSLFSARLTSLLFGLTLLIAIYAIAAQLYSPRIGLLAVALVALSRTFIYSSHLARQDIIVAAFGFGAIALYLSDRHKPFPLRSMLAGLAIGLAIEIHPNGAIYAPAIAALCLVEQGRHVLRSKQTWAVALGMLAGVVYYSVMHILPYPATYSALTKLAFSATHVPPILSPEPFVWLVSAVNMVGFLLLVGDLRILLVVVAIVVLMRPSLGADRRLPVLSLALLSSLLALVRNQIFYYGILLTPIFDLLVAVLLVRICCYTPSCSHWIYRRMAVASGILLASVATTLSPVLNNPMSEFEATLERVTDAVSDEGKVMGSQLYWFALPERTYYSWEQIVYYQRRVPGSTVEDVMQGLRPDFLIIDSHTDQFVYHDEAIMPSYFRGLYVSKGDFDAFLQNRARLVLTIDTQNFGAVRIYRLHW